MRFSTLFAAAAMAAPTVFAGPTGRPGFGCAAPEPTAEQLEVSAAMAIQEAQMSHEQRRAAQAAVNVEVYFHVVAASTSLADGYITQKMASDQFKVLQDTFAPHGLTFTLKNTTWTVNKSWASDGDELAMKKALRKGSYKTLNIYFLKDASGAFGYCYFPTRAAAGSSDFYLDGCSILFTTVPGGSATNYNLGYTVTHEVGHWFGLYHTFQGGCTGAGDSVSDTPAQSSPTSGCPVGRDSCPSQSGVDPIHNFMDYSYDTCYEEFTPGQEARIHSYWTQYRANARA